MSKLQSPFFLLPVEIRCEIYGYFLPDRIHIRLEGDQLRFSECLELENRFPNEYSGHWTDSSINVLVDRRRPKGAEPSNPVWRRRLQSIWGSHWRCEEHIMRKPAKGKFDMRDLLHACKKMDLELVDLLVRTAKVCVIHDLETIGYLRRIAQTPHSSVDGLALKLLGLTQLNICLRLPLSFYESLDTPSIIDTPTLVLSETVQTWLHAASTITQLENLTRLRIELDYDNQCPWTVVRKRVLLQPLVPLSGLETLDLRILLPKLHPNHRRQEHHFTEEIPTDYQLYLRFAWRYSVDVKSQGAASIRKTADFPIVFDNNWIVI